MTPDCFFPALMEGYRDPALHLELRRLNFDADDRNRIGVSEWYPLNESSLDYAARTARLWDRHGNVYMGVLPRHERKRKDEYIPEARLLWVEIDGSEAGQDGARRHLDRAVEEGLFPPHLVIGSGGGVHCYFYLREGCRLEGEGRETYSLLLKRLCFQMAGLLWKPDRTLIRVDMSQPFADPVSTNVGRILRVPGTTNHKREREVKILEANPTAPRLTFAQWDHYLYDAPVKREFPASSRTFGPGQLPPATRRLMEECHHTSERYGALRTILCAARHHGWSKTGLTVLCQQFAVNNPGPPRCSTRVMEGLVQDTLKRVPVDAA